MLAVMIQQHIQQRIFSYMLILVPMGKHKMMQLVSAQQG